MISPRLSLLVFVDRIRISLFLRHAKSGPENKIPPPATSLCENFFMCRARLRFCRHTSGSVLAHAPAECSAHSKDTTALQMFLDLDDSDIVDISIPTLASTFCMSSTVAPT